MFSYAPCFAIILACLQLVFAGTWTHDSSGRAVYLRGFNTNGKSTINVGRYNRINGNSDNTIVRGRVNNQVSNTKTTIGNISTNGNSVTIDGKTYTGPVTVNGVTIDANGNISF